MYLFHFTLVRTSCMLTFPPYTSPLQPSTAPLLLLCSNDCEVSHWHDTLQFSNPLSPVIIATEINGLFHPPFLEKKEGSQMCCTDESVRCWQMRNTLWRRLLKQNWASAQLLTFYFDVTLFTHVLLSLCVSSSQEGGMYVCRGLK